MTETDIVVHIVDDDEAVRHSLAFLLTNSGFAVRLHPSATAFLEQAKTGGNGCLVTDLRMPDMSGVQLLQRLRKAGMTLPTIVITGHGEVRMAVEAMKNGALDFIEKPFSEEVLIQSIRQAVSAAALQQDGEASRESIRQRLASLSERERQVLKAVLKGQVNKTIGFQLGISARTVEVHRAALMAKMQARSLAELVRMVLGQVNEEDWE